MKNRLIFGLMAAVAFVAAASSANAGGLTGQTINIDREIPSIGFDYNVGLGLSGAYTVGVSPPYALSTGNNLNASATDTDLIVDFGPDGGLGGLYSDHAIIFSDLYLGTGFVVSGFDIVTNTVPGITQSDISFGPHEVKILIGNAIWTGGQELDILLQTSAVPEPSTLTLAALGVIGVGYLAWRTRRASDA